MLVKLNDVSLTNKKVILRVDFNCPTQDGKILSYQKVNKSLETINYLLKNNCKVIILSHFGRVKSASDKSKNSLYPIYQYLKNELKYDVLFSSEPMGPMLERISRNLKPKQILLVENTRFLDIPKKLESSNDIQLAMFWASLAEFYIDDAFASMHRSHASVVGIANILPSAVGLLVQNEIQNLSAIIERPNRPFIVVMGGAKLDDKIELIYTLIEKCDYMLLGGGIANTFLKAAGFEIGNSLYSENMIMKARSLMEEFPDKIILPKDAIVKSSYSDEVLNKNLSEITEEDSICDIGINAIDNFTSVLYKARTIFLNGTLGKYEQLEFSNGTRMILDFIASSSANVIVGGGDAAAALEKYSLTDKINFVSTGGGATLYYLANEYLPGLDAIGTQNEKYLD